MGSSGLIEAFERRFLAARPLPSFPWRSLEEKLKNSLDSELLLNILQKTVLHPLCVKHPPSVKYTQCFLSELIKKHEAAHTEPLDELYEALAEILSAEESTQGHRSYLLPSGNSISLCESTAIISQGTTGLVTWDAALYLAEWAIENPEAFTNRRVLELGSGAGFTGLAICKMCSPTAYIFSDCHSQVLQQLKGNILLNGFLLNPDSTAPLQPSISTLVSPKPIVMAVQLDWEQVTTKQLSVFQPDVIIAADVLYDPEIILSLIGVLQKLSTCQADQKPPEIYIAFTVRNPDTYQMFKMELSKVGIGWQKLPSHNQKMFPYEKHSEMVILRLLV
ncbi:protein-lysine N-methyltransferase EEF2KMT [Antechinus flavipes]|uniref:protein-lysine N-methyltransferase EEF2KMT n=1 Tax=Antechinus flavipes TaxID=38775 RepID=UPI00223632D9|nr:protein-lysine N-methyltransferase EEF2KMT [Antechinus flavipes]